MRRRSFRMPTNSTDFMELEAEGYSVVRFKGAAPPILAPGDDDKPTFYIPENPNHKTWDVYFADKGVLVFWQITVQSTMTEHVRVFQGETGKHELENIKKLAAGRECVLWYVGLSAHISKKCERPEGFLFSDIAEVGRGVAGVQTAVASVVSKNAKKRKKPAEESEKLFECLVAGCGRSFKRRQDLTKHKHVHAGEKPGEKPFVCQVVGCDKTFATRDLLKGHTNNGYSNHKHLFDLV
jgi:hypothetical protein